MKYDPAKHHRKSIRLKGHDYTSPGAYFVTICVQGRACVLGEVMDGEMQLSDEGQIAAESWVWLEEQYPYVMVDAWVVMPNHTHAIITIHDDSTGGSGTGGSRTAPTVVKRKPLGRLIGAFKTVSTKQINRMHNTPGARFWQRNYWEHIVRNQTAYQRIYQYIQNNSACWEDDQLHPNAPPNPFNRG